MDRSRHPWRRLAVLAALGIATLAVTYVVVHTGANEAPAPWWPASGLGAISLLVVPRRWWVAVLPTLFVVLLVGNVAGGHPTAASAVFSGVDAVEAAAVAWLTQQWVGSSLDSVRALLRFFGAVFGVTTLTGLVIAVASSALMGGAWAQTWPMVSASHAAAVLLIVPVVFSRRSTASPPRVELLVQTLLLAAVLVGLVSSASSLAAVFAPVPLLVWAALRFGERVVVLEQAALAVAVTLIASASDSVTMLAAHPDSYFSAPQFYLVWLALTGLPVNVAMREREVVHARIAASEQLFRRNFSEALIPVCFLKYDGVTLRLEELNDTAVALFGRTTQQVAGHEVADLLTRADDLTRAAAAMFGGRSRGWTGDLGQVGQPSRILRAHLALIDDPGAGGERPGARTPATLSLHLLDMTATLTARAELEREMTHTRAVLDAADSMIIVAAHDGTVLAVNPASLEITGFAESDLVGRKCWDVLPVPELRAVVRSYFRPGGVVPASGVTRILCADDTVRTVSFSNAQVMPRSGADPYHVLTGIDVTAERDHAHLMEHLLRSASTVAFVGTDLDGTITLLNTGAESMLGVSADQARGRPLSSYVLESRPPDGPAPTQDGRTRAFDAMIARVGAHGAPETRDWQWVGPHGTSRTVSMTTSTVTDSGGNPLGLLFVGRDVSDTRRSQEILVSALRREREASAKLRALDAAKDEFISTVSHELRTPMTSIIGTAELLGDGAGGPLTGQQLAMVRVIARNGDRLLGLANDLLSVARFDSGTTSTTTKPTDLRTVVAESREASASLTHQRDLALHISVPPAPVWVHGDPRQLERAVTNLISNAVKFTPDGGAVTTSLVLDDDGRTARLSVSDTGIGISSDELDRVFERFFRTSMVQEQAIQGTGLGLAIVKSIVESHGGSVSVSSAPGQGTTFTLTLPVIDAPAAPRRPPAVEEAAPALIRSDSPPRRRP